MKIVDRSGSGSGCLVFARLLYRCNQCLAGSCWALSTADKEFILKRVEPWAYERESDDCMRIRALLAVESCVAIRRGETR